ncbi:MULTISPECIES: (2Fe-2S)-binding protein [unclassified Methylophilus]|uniref:(2Fe-2S)-binding protein n=1 Tax=unclassified Methylophilus TaxID=2630143 RepID=UPI0006F46A95|nr:MULTISPECIES: (2Fe-2S)-binding protein [unclassified Methylophilus]KQT41238.1 (2Fe-2S)-binding protein [Methylophilus sp. Leaf416]KQT57760.1 (2Fe-2S)-binding protein [Methylophilus sp. Leaf459]
MAELKQDSPDEVMCSCSGTTRGMIQDLVKQGKDLDGISRYSGALSGCGGCEWDIGELVKELMADLPAALDQEKPDQEKPD